MLAYYGLDCIGRKRSGDFYGTDECTLKSEDSNRHCFQIVTHSVLHTNMTLPWPLVSLSAYVRPRVPKFVLKIMNDIGL